MKRNKCIGYPIHSKCDNSSGPKSKYWCDACEKKRRKQITENFKQIAISYGWTAEEFDNFMNSGERKSNG